MRILILFVGLLFLSSCGGDKLFSEEKETLDSLYLVLDYSALELENLDTASLKVISKEIDRLAAHSAFQGVDEGRDSLPVLIASLEQIKKQINEISRLYPEYQVIIEDSRKKIDEARKKLQSKTLDKDEIGDIIITEKDKVRLFQNELSVMVNQVKKSIREYDSIHPKVINILKRE